MSIYTYNHEKVQGHLGAGQPGAGHGLPRSHLEARAGRRRRGRLRRGAGDGRVLSERGYLRDGAGAAGVEVDRDYAGKAHISRSR